MVAGEITVAGVAAQRQAHMNQMVQKTIEISQWQHTDQVVDVPVVVVSQVPQVHVVMKTVETPRVQIVAETTEIPCTQGLQTSESLSVDSISRQQTEL